MEETLTNNEEKGITYHQLGFMSAMKSSCHIGALEGLLPTAYNLFLEKQQLDEKGIEDRIVQLQSEVMQEEAKKNELHADINTQKELLDSNRERTQELELERIELKKRRWR